MSKVAGDPERAINGLLSVVQLLEEPRLARLYTFVLREEEVSIDDIVDTLEMPQMSERVAARELDLQHAFAIAVLQALREVVLDMKSVDPYFDDIRSARDQPPETAD